MCNQQSCPEPTTHPTLVLTAKYPPCLGQCLCHLPIDCLLYEITRPHCSHWTENAWEGETRVRNPTLCGQSRISAESSRATRKAGSRSGTPAKAFLLCICWKATVWTRLQLPYLNAKGSGWCWLLLSPAPQWPLFSTWLFPVYLRTSQSYGAERLQMSSGLDISTNMQKPVSFSVYSTIPCLIIVIISLYLVTLYSSAWKLQSCLWARLYPV